MTTWFIDPLNGTNSDASAGNGDSFATRRKSISNIVAAASAPGDTVKIMGSPDATSLGVTGVWTEGPPTSGVAITSASNATPIVVTQASHPFVNGDTVFIANVGGNTNANGLWDVANKTSTTFELKNPDGTNSVGNGSSSGGNSQLVNSLRVKLASAVTKTICLTGNKGTKTNWTASANVTCTVDTSDWKEGQECQKIDIAAGFTTGLAAYIPLAGATDFSAYQQITFWIKQTSGTIGATGDIQIKLCSDAVGATPVDTFNITTVGVLNYWMPITIDKGSALGASIQSVSFNVVTDNGAQIFFIDNMQACKASSSADSLTLNSLIGKANTGGRFYGLCSINNNLIFLGQDNNQRVVYNNTPRGYYTVGGSGTVTTYKRECFKTTPATSLGGFVQEVKEAGTSGNLINYSGGWNTTDMTTQTMETWFDGQNNNGYGIYLGSLDYIGMSKIGFVRYYTLNLASNFSVFSLLASSNNLIGILGTSFNRGSFTIDACNNHQQSGINLGNQNSITVGEANGSLTFGLAIAENNKLTATDICGNVSYGISSNGANKNTYYVTNIKNNSAAGILFQNSDGHLVVGATIEGNASYGILYAGTYHKAYLRNCIINQATEVSGTAQTYSGDGGIYSQKHDQTLNNHYNFLNNGIIQSEASVRHTASGISWKVSPTSTAYVFDAFPFILPVAKVACNASALVTVKLWMRRTNTGLTARLVCKGKQIAGVDADVTSAMTVAADTWEEITITFTPSEVGVVEITAECFGGTTYSLYVDDLTITQA